MKAKVKASYRKPRTEIFLFEALRNWFQDWPNRESFPQYQKDKRDFIELLGEEVFEDFKNTVLGE